DAQAGGDNFGIQSGSGGGGGGGGNASIGGCTTGLRVLAVSLNSIHHTAMPSTSKAASTSATVTSN
ncbi:hypothetical protein ACCC87_08230, partial [Stenotrophomonas geniculata]